jgi:hypothetical protein
MSLDKESDFFKSFLHKYYDCMSGSTLTWKKHHDCIHQLENMVEQDIRWPVERIALTSVNPVCADLIRFKDTIRTLDDVNHAFKVGFHNIPNQESTVFFSIHYNDMLKTKLLLKMRLRYDFQTTFRSDCDMSTRQKLRNSLIGNSYSATDNTISFRRDDLQ